MGIDGGEVPLVGLGVMCELGVPDRQLKATCFDLQAVAVVCSWHLVMKVMFFFKMCLISSTFAVSSLARAGGTCWSWSGRRRVEVKLLYFPAWISWEMSLMSRRW